MREISSRGVINLKKKKKGHILRNDIITVVDT